MTTSVQIKKQIKKQEKLVALYRAKSRDYSEDNMKNICIYATLSITADNVLDSLKGILSKIEEAEQSWDYADKNGLFKK